MIHLNFVRFTLPLIEKILLVILNIDDYLFVIQLKDDTDILATDGVGRSTNLEGYLFKRSHGTFRSWNRRWFYLDSNKVSNTKWR